MHFSDELRALRNRLRPPPLYYGTSEAITPGKVLCQEKRPGLPQAIYCHPADLPRLRLLIPQRELVHLSEWQPTDEDMRAMHEQFQKQLAVELRYGEWR